MEADKREGNLDIGAIPAFDGALAGPSPSMVSPGCGKGGSLKKSRKQLRRCHGRHHKPAGDLDAEGDGKYR